MLVVAVKVEIQNAKWRISNANEENIENGAHFVSFRFVSVREFESDSESEPESVFKFEFVGVFGLIFEYECEFHRSSSTTDPRGCLRKKKKPFYICFR